MYYIEIDKEKAHALIEFIELNLFTQIRNDPGIDNVDYVANICEIYKSAKEVLAEEGA